MAGTFIKPKYAILQLCPRTRNMIVSGYALAFLRFKIRTVYHESRLKGRESI